MSQARQDDGFAAMWAHPVTRRGLLRAAGIGVGALGVGSVLPGCTAEAPAERETGGTGGQLPAALANTFLDLDPVVASAVGTVAVNNLVYESLYRIDPFPPRTSIEPELAAAMPEEVTPTRYRIPLREGVTFHDGSPLTADDVVYTIERIKAPKTNSLFARFFEIIEKAEASGEHDVQLTLAAPTTLLAQRLVLVKGMSKAAVGGSPNALKLAPVGTGPYQVDKAVSGQRVTLTPFKNYRGAHKPTYDDVRISVVADANARVSGLRSGQTKVIEDVPASTFKSLQQAADLEVKGVRSAHMTGLMFHCGKRPFDDVRVRRAVMYAIDRDAITKSSFFGHASPVWSGEISPDDADYAKPKTTYRYDPEHAKKLLAEAGYGKGGIKVDFLTGNLDYLSSQAPVIEENLRSVGFVPNQIPGELESLYARVTKGTYDLFLMKGDTSALGITDAEFALRWIYYGAVPRGFLYWTGKPLQRVEQLLDDALTAGDGDERSRLLAQVQDIVQDEVPIGRLHRTDQLTGWSSSLKNFRPSPTAGFVLDGVRG